MISYEFVGEAEGNRTVALAAISKVSREEQVALDRKLAHQISCVGAHRRSHVPLQAAFPSSASRTACPIWLLSTFWRLYSKETANLMSE